MSNEPSPPQNRTSEAAIPEGQAMVEWLATEVMGWKRISVHGFPVWNYGSEEGLYLRIEDSTVMKCDCGKKWNPLESWDDWRQVEEKVMEDAELFDNYMVTLYRLTEDAFPQYGAVKSDLPTRAKALYLAYQSLNDR